MIGKIPPKGVSFSDFTTIFAMSVRDYLIIISNTKLSNSNDLAKLEATFCYSQL